MARVNDFSLKKESKYEKILFFFFFFFFFEDDGMGGLASVSEFVLQKIKILNRIFLRGKGVRGHRGSLSKCFFYKDSKYIKENFFLAWGGGGGGWGGEGG